jgi:hypothetical protein
MEYLLRGLGALDALGFFDLAIHFSDDSSGISISFSNLLKMFFQHVLLWNGEPQRWTLPSLTGPIFTNCLHSIPIGDCSGLVKFSFSAVVGLGPI